ncbi:insulinase family protein [Myxococcota bacterium]|nr:insulinase family protein [Myxococcota bacterium]
MSPKSIWGGLAAVLLAPAGVAAAGGEQAPSIPSIHYELANGLDVVLHQDRDLPLVAVSVWYHVGSKQEQPGLTGFAHLFEHLMFQGSAHHRGEYMELLIEAGGQVNGSTSAERTDYWQVLPSNQLELALWLESDRMGWLLPALDQANLDNQRDVVRNERRQRYENVPYGLARKYIVEGIWPEGHPYHHLPIGDHADLERASLDDVKAFFRRWYVPQNASIAIAGDIDVEATKALVEKYFGSIPGGEPAPALEPPPVHLASETVEVIEDPNVPFPRIWLNWRTPPIYAPGDAALDVLSSVLTDGKSSRLYRSLVYEKRIAQDVAAYQASAQLGSVYTIVATAAPGHDADELKAAIDAEIERLRAEPPGAEEMERALNGWRKGFFSGLEGVLARATQLNSYLHYLGTPDHVAEDLDRYLAVTAEDVQGAVADWLRPDARYVLVMTPKAAVAEEARP